MPNLLQSIPSIDTKEDATDYCKIPGGRGGGFKWPSLTELHQTLFGKTFAEAHNASADVEATARCFLELLRLEVITFSKAGMSTEQFAKYKQLNQNTIELIGLNTQGHYAQIREDNGRYVVSKGLDESKDQSYVLWGVTQECLKRTIFPIGKYHKKDIKQMAIDRGYVALAEKNESYEICFIPDNDYRGFLKRKIGGLEEKVKGGNFVTIKGDVVGIHDGYPFYTIGQRKLGVSLGKDPAYVIGINPDENTVVVGSREELKKQEMFVRDINYLKYPKIKDGMECLVKVRYKHKGEKAKITNDGENLKVLFHKKVEGIAPGQSAAIYEGDDLIAGGFILKK